MTQLLNAIVLTALENLSWHRSRLINEQIVATSIEFKDGIAYIPITIQTYPRSKGGWYTKLVRATWRVFETSLRTQVNVTTHIDDLGISNSGDSGSGSGRMSKDYIDQHQHTVLKAVHAARVRLNELPWNDKVKAFAWLAKQQYHVEDEPAMIEEAIYKAQWEDTYVIESRTRRTETKRVRLRPDSTHNRRTGHYGRAGSSVLRQTD